MSLVDLCRKAWFSPLLCHTSWHHYWQGAGTCQWEESQGREKCRWLQGPNELSAPFCWATTQKCEEQTARSKWKKHWYWKGICTFYIRTKSHGSQNTPDRRSLGSWLDTLKLLDQTSIHWLQCGLYTIKLWQHCRQKAKRSQSKKEVEIFGGCHLFVCACVPCY